MTTGSTEGTAQARPPRVSVIVPCFNQGAYLDEALDSVAAQTFQDFEILVVDDGSTDEETRRLLDAYSRPRTAIFRTPNRGLARARNFLIARATGEYVCALDADDRLHPEYFEKALGRFEEDPGLTFASAWIQEFGRRDATWRRTRCDLPALLAEDTVMTAALVRRDAVVAAGGYDEGMPAQGDEDWELWLRLVRAGHRGTIIPETLFYYRRRPGSMSEACTGGQTHLDLVRYIVRKHAPAYREHLHEVLLAKEEIAAGLLRGNDRREREIDGRLRPELALRRAELETVRGRVALRRAEGGAGAAALAAGHRRALDEIHALRTSWSWRITAPLRAAYDLLRSVRPARGGRAG